VGGGSVSAEVEIGRTPVPGASQGALIDPTTGVAYVLAQYVRNASGTAVDSRLYAVDGGVVVDEVPLPYAAVSFDIDPTTQRAYVVTSAYPTYTLRVVDLSTMTLLPGTFPLPSQTFGVDADPVSGRVALSAINPGRVIVLDGSNLTQVGSVSVTDTPFRVAFSEGADRLYVTRASASTLLLTGVGYSTIDTIPSTHGQSLALDHGANVLYVSSMVNGLFKIDLSTNTVLANDPTPPWGQYTSWIALADNGERLLGPDGNGYVTEIDTATLAEVGVIGPAGLYYVDADDATGRMVALLGGGCCINGGELVELAPTMPPTVPPVASAVASTVVEGDPFTDNYGDVVDAIEATVTVALDAPSTEWSRVSVEFTPGTATNPQDYVAYGAEVVHFAPGQTFAQASLYIRADEVSEQTETMSFRVVGALGASVDSTPAVITISDDDVPPPVASISPVEPLGVEGDGVVDFLVELDRPSDVEVTVDWAVSDGTATAGDDYDGTGGQAVFAPGETEVSQTVAVLDDVLVEGDESFTISLTGASGASPNGVAAVATILDDDEVPPPLPVASIQPGDPSALESDGVLEFFIELDGASSDEVTVDWAALSGSAVAGDDFDGSGGTATFAAGDTLVAVSVPIVDDVAVETDESLTISLTGASGASVDGVDVGATIIDDDAPPSVVSAGANIAVVEGAGGTTRVGVVRVLFSPATSGEVELSWVATPNTATSGDDYLVGGPLVVPAGTATADIEVEIVGDNLDEVNETFDVEIVDVTGNAVLDADVTARVTITDDDAIPRLSVDDVSAGEGDPLGFTVSLSAPSGRVVTVRYATSRVAPTSTADVTSVSGTITFDPGETTASVGMPTTEDNIDELDNRVDLILSSATNAGISDNRGVGIIVDDDTAVVSLVGVTIAEGSSGTRNANFVMVLSNPSDRQVQVTLGTLDGTATSVTAQRDYQAFNGNVTFLPGQRSKVVPVKVVGDRRVETDETFSLVVNATTNGAEGIGNTATGTITNDD
jgi:hypothetical protein